MDFDATAAWCNDLGLDLESDVVVFALAELTKAPRMGYFERKAWIEGWRSEKKDNIEAQKAYLDTLRKKLSSDPEYFKKVYAFCFDYAKESGQKSLGASIMHSISISSEEADIRMYVQHSKSHLEFGQYSTATHHLHYSNPIQLSHPDHRHKQVT